MHRRRIVLSVVLLALAVLIGMYGAVFERAPRELVVPIDRSVLETLKAKSEAIIPDSEVRAGEEARSRALKPAPDARLVEKTPLGLLPRKAENGDRPADLYARPFDLARLSGDKPKLSLVLTQAGISETLTAEAYLALPPDVSFIMSPYAHDAERQMRDIRNRGHEIFLGLSSSVDAESHEDRGPHALDVTKSRDQNHGHLIWAMTRVSGYVGLLGDMTEQAFLNPDLRELIESETKARGLVYLPIVRRNSQSFNHTADHARLSSEMAKYYLSGHKPSELKSALDSIVSRLDSKSRTLVFVEPGPLAIDVLKEWLRDPQSRAFDLVPLSALMRLEGQG